MLRTIILGVVLGLMAPLALVGEPPETNASADRVLSLWVTKPFSEDVALHSELRINDQTIGQFSGPTNRAISQFVKSGWNTFTLRTTVNPVYHDRNWLKFTIGMVYKDPESKKMVMNPVLWSFDNVTDWKFDKGAVYHQSSPEAHEGTIGFSLFYAGPEPVQPKLKNGDFVLGIRQHFSENPTATAAIIVNGTPFSSLMGPDRNQLVITGLLKKGKNEVKVITHRVRGGMCKNDIEIQIGGPADYSPRQEKFQMPIVQECHAITGWEQDKKSGLWHIAKKPEMDSIERVLTFELDSDPKGD